MTSDGQMWTKLFNNFRPGSRQTWIKYRTQQQRPKKSGWQLSTRKNFPDEVRKSFSRQKKTRKSFSRQKSVRKLFLQQKSVLKSFLQQKSVR